MRVNRRGFTLIELLITIAIIAILASLLLVGVVKVRESMNSHQCQMNLMQVGMALQGFQHKFGYYPHNGGWDGKQTIQDTSGKPVTVFTNDYVSGKWTWGVGDPMRGTKDQPGSWLVTLLPSLGQENVYLRRDWDVALAVYACPSRRGPFASAAVNDARGEYQGGGWTWAHADYAGNARLFPARPKNQRRSAITDGFSQTILVGEKALDANYYTTGTWYWDEPYFLGGSDSTSRKGEQVLRDRPGAFMAARENWGSAHSRGVHFLFADGAAKAVDFSVGAATVRALLTPAGKDATGEW